jgi:chromosome segregation ATPase
MDPTLATIIIALVINGPAWFALRSANQKARGEQAEALIKAQSDAKTEATRRDQLEAELTEKVLTRADNEIEKYQKRVTALEKQQDADREVIDDLRKRDRNRYETEIELRGRIASWEDAVKALQNQLIVKEGKLAEAAILIAELQARDRDREAAMAALQADIEKDRVVRDEVVRVLTEKVNALERERTELRQRVLALESELNRRDQLIQKLKAASTNRSESAN